MRKIHDKRGIAAEYEFSVDYSVVSNGFFLSNVIKSHLF